MYVVYTSYISHNLQVITARGSITITLSLARPRLASLQVSIIPNDEGDLSGMIFVVYTTYNYIYCEASRPLFVVC